ncbi:P44/Msp2 family outer membrane protein [Wolbachia endosymbiont of Dirofilaria (Dirofilaria) immitis]|nr:P44/Msp2 family outer membrane protein [Wolbachia endosymbiont of Dirofilaria (Dirofilaria) immitis]QKX02376.1 P44/Msp2 family outer membrane protein [Wolbachia endosymbiont of Dirofilaria (Dirofilaria) immitis]
MNNKKILVVTVFALLLSQQSFASKTEGFYFDSGYHSQLFNSIGLLKVRKMENDPRKHITINKMYLSNKIKDQKTSEYRGDYNPPFAGGIAFGYEGKLGNNNYRAELEGMYSSVKADNIGLKGNWVSVLYFRVIGEGENRKTYMYAAKVDNDRIENTSIMANACYYLKSDSFSFFPYIGAGIGLTRMKMFGEASVGPAYQLKAGLAYRINKDVNMRVGYRHFGAFSKGYKLKADLLGEVKSGTSGTRSTLLDDSVRGIPLIGIEKQENINASSGLLTTHGIEAGLTFHFANEA